MSGFRTQTCFHIKLKETARPYSITQRIQIKKIPSKQTNIKYILQSTPTILILLLITIKSSCLALLNTQKICVLSVSLCLSIVMIK